MCCFMYFDVKDKMTFPTAKQRTKLTRDIFKQCLSSRRISIDIQVLQNLFYSCLLFRSACFYREGRKLVFVQ